MMIIKDVTKNYGKFTAIEGIQLELSEGVYGLLAPNGAGKTTLIKMMATLITPTQGEILYEGQNILTLDERYREMLGYLPQEFGYYKHYSPKQYLLYLATLKGMNKKEALKQTVEVLERVSLGNVLNRKMRTFSGGMIQRVGIAQALLNDPKILILDEPTAGLDPKERARIRRLITDIAHGKLIFISTHIVSDIESIANEVIMIKNKGILYKHSVDEICSQLNGRVFETDIPRHELKQFYQQYFVLAERQESGQIHVRFIHEGETKNDWQHVLPTLEDVFLYEYQDEERVKKDAD